MNREQEILKRAQDFAAAHVIEGAREILELADTTILRNGVVRQCHAILREWETSHDTLGVARALFERAALEKLVKDNP